MKQCNFCKEEYKPIQVARSLGKESGPYKLGFCSAHCYTQFLEPKIFMREKETPFFAHNVPPVEFDFVCAQMGLQSTDGVQPGTKTVTIYAPNGTPVIFLTCQAEPIDKIGVRVTVVEEI